MKKRLAKIDQLIARFEQLIRDFPNDPNMRQLRDQLKQERAELTSKIGR